MSEKHRVEKLPKNSRCVDYKSVPSRSSYHDSDNVDRCAKFATDGGDGGGGDDSGGDDGIDVPESVGSFHTVEPTEREAGGSVFWQWDHNPIQPRDPGDMSVYIFQRRDPGILPEWETKVTGDNIHTSTIVSRDTGREVVSAAVEWMENNQSTAFPEFSITVPNDVFRPSINALKRRGSGGRSFLLEIRHAKDPARDFQVLRLESAGGAVASIPLTNIDGDWKMGSVSCDLSDWWDVARKTNKSDSVRLTFDPSDDHARVRANGSGGPQSSLAARRKADYHGFDRGDAKGPADAMLSLPGKEYRRVVRAGGALLETHDNPDVQFIVTEDTAALALERGSTGETFKGEFRQENVNRMNGEGAVELPYQALDSGSVVVPKPASTSVTLFVYDGVGLVQEYIIEDGGARITLAYDGEPVDDMNLAEAKPIPQSEVLCPGSDRN